MGTGRGGWSVVEEMGWAGWGEHGENVLAWIGWDRCISVNMIGCQKQDGWHGEGGVSTAR